MKREFVVDQLIALEGSGFYYDLHNCYNFEGIELLKNDLENKVTISFRKIMEPWVKYTDPDVIIISFKSIRYLYFSDSFFSKPSKDVEEIGYKDEADRNYEYIQGEEQASIDSHMFFRLGNGEFLRIFADEVVMDVYNI